MLFAIKNRLIPTLLLLFLFIAAAIYLRDALGLTWHYELVPIDFLLAAFVMAASDGLLHAFLAWTLGAAYLSRFRALVHYFRPQHAPEIVAGGLLAGGEELIFRGVLLEGLQSLAGIPPVAAVGVAALVFGLLHALPNKTLFPFTFWAIWEGVLLGGVYVLSGSLVVVVLLHVLHDIGGFSVFAYQRRHWQ
jgi:membrane protease YdiL (CAAX protease family)